jgi:mono/diheme cytochrome c family protein
MGKRLNRTSSSVLAPTALLSMTLALSACSDKQEKAPTTPGSASVFKDSPSPESPSAPAPGMTPPAAQGGQPQTNAGRTPEQLFFSLGCRACHAPGAAFGPVLANARGKPPEVVAMWILDPQKVKPGTMMPSFSGRLSTSEALALANWIKAGHPTAADSP